MIGKTISHYKIQEKLGEGGMGIVYLAEDTRLLRSVALKFLPSDLVSNDYNRRRFMLEAQTASSLNHPNICVIHDIIDTENSNYIVMEFVEGKTLRTILDEQGPMPEEEVANITLKICDALAAVHNKGILHRDIKPENIMITDSGFLKVMDFGLAKLATETATENSGFDVKEKSDNKKNYMEDVVLKTLTGMLGTVSYMSPEQAQGKEIDHRSDIFSLGIVLYELLTNKRPFDGDSNITILSKIVEDSIVHRELDLQEISTSMRKIINRCLEKIPEKRYQSISDLILDLNKITQRIEHETKRKQTDSSIISEPERRKMTVMFAEITNYTEITTKMDVEEAASIMSNCFEIFASIVEEHGGKIDNISGGEIKILFGADSESENINNNAVNSAIEMRNRLNGFNQKNNLSIPLDIRIGINHGMVVVGSMGVGKNQSYMVMGDTVTYASQLKDLADEGKVLVSFSTYKLTKNDFDYKEKEQIVLPGKEEEIKVYELLSVKTKLHRPQLGTERQISSEMVGRDGELRKLKEFLLKLIDGFGYIVNIVGEAGIGKSRLIAELKSENEISNVTFLEGRALSIGKNLSFHPLIDIMKSWCGITEDDTEKKAFSKLEQQIINIYPEQSEEVFPFIATMMGMELGGSYSERIKGIKGEALEKLILKNLREFFKKSASQNPIIFVIEDLHWADNTSIEFLELLYRLAENNRILFVNVFRPDFKNTGERILESIKERYPSSFETIYLESLNKSYGETLINNLLNIEGFSPQITETITQRAGGNPFFIEEVIRAFIDDGIVEIKNERFVVTQKIDSVVIPETINEVLMARIDKLDEGTKSLLKTASVIGRNFFYKILAEIVKTTEELDNRLAYLRDVQLIREQKRMEEVEYLFKHALAQSVAYESLLLKKRKELHIKTAAAIEIVFSEKLSKFYGILAYHYNIGQDFDKAEEYLIKAGEEALKSSASSEAIEYFKDALNLYIKKYGSKADPKKKAKLEYNIGLALQYKGRLEESVEYLDRVMDYHKLTIPKNKFFLLLKAVLGILHLLTGIYLPSLKWRKKRSEEISENFRFLINWQNSVMFVFPVKGIVSNLIFWIKFSKYELTGLGEMKFVLLGNPTSFSLIGIFRSIHKKSLNLLNEKMDKNILIENLIHGFSNQMYNWVWGNWNISIEKDYDNKLVEGGIKIGELQWILLYMNQFILTKIERGDFIEAENMLLKLSEIAEDYENDYIRAIYYESSTKLLIKHRKISRALIKSDEGINFTSRTNARFHNFANLSYKARIQLLMGDIIGAEKTLKSAASFKSEIEVPWYLSDFLTSQFLFDIYNLEKSIKSRNNQDISVYTIKTIKSRKEAYNNSKKFAGDRIEIYRLVGRYYWLINRQKKALKWWDRSIQFAEESGGRLELSRTFMEVGKRLIAKKSKYKELNGVSAKEYLEKARFLFEEMDLQWDLEELRKNNSP